MFKKKRNNNSEQNQGFAKEIENDKVKKEENTPDYTNSDLNNERRRYDDYEFGSDYGDNFFTSDYERRNFNRDLGFDEITNMEMGKEDCCKEK